MATPEELKGILEKARTIAVVGISRDPEKPAHDVPRRMQAHGYRIIPVNPAGGEILGEKVYPSLDDIPEELVRQVDIVDIFRPSDQVGPHVEAAIRLHVPVVWLQLGIRNDEWAEKARQAGLTVIQDTCIWVAYRTYVLGQ